MNPKYPGSVRGSSRMQDNPPFLGERETPRGRCNQISPFWAPIGRSGGDPGDEIGKTGAHCFTKTPNFRLIAGFVGFACPKKGPNGPKWWGDSSRDGLADVGMTECGYGVPVLNAGTRVTLMISTLARHTPSWHSPTWGSPGYSEGRRQQVPDSSIFGDEIAKMGAHCFTEIPNCCLIAGLRELACPKKGPNRPNWRGDLSPDGLADVETGKHGSGDPTRNAPDFTATGNDREKNMKDRRGRYPA